MKANMARLCAGLLMAFGAAGCSQLHDSRSEVATPQIPLPPPRELTEAEQGEAVAIAEAADQTAEIIRAGRSILVGVDLARSKEAEERGRPDRFALVTHYRYEGDLTVETLVNVTAGDVLEVRSASHQPAPLSNAEFETAKKLALDDPEVTDNLAVPIERLVIEPLLSVAGSADDPLFGHRVVRLLFKLDRDYLADPIVLVDLTEERVIVERRSDLE